MGKKLFCSFLMAVGLTFSLAGCHVHDDDRYEHGRGYESRRYDDRGDYDRHDDDRHEEHHDDDRRDWH